MTIKLYCFGESGNAYKAALPLALSGLDWAPVKVDFFNGETRTPEYRANVNEMGEAPVLVDGDIRIYAQRHKVAAVRRTEGTCCCVTLSSATSTTRQKQPAQT